MGVTTITEGVNTIIEGVTTSRTLKRIYLNENEAAKWWRDWREVEVKEGLDCVRWIFGPKSHYTVCQSKKSYFCSQSF